MAEVAEGAPVSDPVLVSVEGSFLLHPPLLDPV